VSPDGRRIAYLGFDNRGKANNNANLYVMNTDGSGSRQLAANLDRNILAPRWMPDSTGLYAVVESRGQAQLYSIPLDAPAKPITTGAFRFTTAYATSDTFSVSNNGVIAITRSSPAETSRVPARRSRSTPRRSRRRRRPS